MVCLEACRHPTSVIDVNFIPVICDFSGPPLVFTETPLRDEGWRTLVQGRNNFRSKGVYLVVQDRLRPHGGGRP